jgi:hypothetical protein
MPAFPIILPNVSQVVGKYTGPGGMTAESVWYVLSNGIAGLEVFNRFSTAWQALQMGHTSTGVRLTSIKVMRLDGQTATEEFDTVGVKWDGTGTGEPLPQVAMLVRYHTTFRGLASHGRTYAPFVSEAVDTAGHMDQSALDTISPAWVSWVNTLTTQTIPLQIVSAGRDATANKPALPAVNHTVTSVSIDPILATQRNRQSRLRG